MHRDDIARDNLFVIDTEKAEVEVEAPATVVEILGEPKGVYPVGAVVAVIATAET
jgi:pyruvate/2-oxoglutarate dehydrogenase complex dihydrolipoamide acyltransferase (E2) component